MAKYLVFSDAHNKNETMLEIIKKEKEMEGVFFLGDLEQEEEVLRNATQGPVYMVRGNCDWHYRGKETLSFPLHGHKIAMTHGHRHRVNAGLDLLKYWAMEQEADVLMYGHTHVPFVEQNSMMTILNPGSISEPRQADRIPTYGVIEFCEGGEVRVELRNVSK